MDVPQLKPPCDYNDALAVLKHLRSQGHVAYFAGGCVRDRLLGLEPKDWDVATDAPPQRVRALFPRTQAVGAAFGVILVRQGKSVVEVATFRADVSYEDGRRPTAVRFTTAEEDARRRDFTINGLFLDPLEDRVIDYVGGQADLTARVLRAIGVPDERFAEDHLRLLRAVRFAARFDLRIEPTTWQAIRNHAAKLARVSPERIADELRRMLTPPSRLIAWRLLEELLLLPVIYRHMGDPALTIPAGKIFPRVAAAETISFPLALAAGALEWRWRCADAPSDVRPLVAPTEIRTIEKAMRRTLRFSNEESDAMTGILSSVASLLADREPTVSQLKRFLATPVEADATRLLVALHHADLHSARIAELLPRLSALSRADVSPPPLITGDDLTAAGLTPGPKFKRVLDAVYDAQLEDRVKTKDEAMAMALEMARD
jgi:tRNA nucleotidyltransferase/poly(A) polymerase